MADAMRMKQPWIEDGYVDWPEESIDPELFATYKEAADFVGYTYNSFKTMFVRQQFNPPLPFVWVKINGAGRPLRFFKWEDLRTWKTLRQENKVTVSRHHSTHPTEIPILTKAKFPDNGNEIPAYVNPLTGRTIRPAWLNCITCGDRFLSEDRRSVRMCQACKNHEPIAAL